MEEASVIERLTTLRQHQAEGKRSPHKPLLLLLALGRLQSTGSSSLSWSVVEEQLGQLLSEFGTPSSTGATSAAYPFTRLRSDGIWTLSRDVPNDSVSALRSSPIEGSFAPDIEAALSASPGAINEAAREIVEVQFPLSLTSDVLIAAGLDPEVVMRREVVREQMEITRKRNATWPRRVLEAWDRSCAFCGYDGRLGGASVGVEAAHVRWFNFDGPDDMDNGIALCSLHHKLLDRGVLGFLDPQTVVVSSAYAATTDRGRSVYDLHESKLRPRPGTSLPGVDHVTWHRNEVFKGQALT